MADRYSGVLDGCATKKEGVVDVNGCEAAAESRGQTDGRSDCEGIEAKRGGSEIQSAYKTDSAGDAPGVKTIKASTVRLVQSS